jgi:hypothetical protein
MVGSAVFSSSGREQPREQQGREQQRKP